MKYLDMIDSSSDLGVGFPSDTAGDSAYNLNNCQEERLNDDTSNGLYDKKCLETGDV